MGSSVKSEGPHKVNKAAVLYGIEDLVGSTGTERQKPVTRIASHPKLGATGPFEHLTSFARHFLWRDSAFSQAGIHREDGHCGLGAYRSAWYLRLLEYGCHCRDTRIFHYQRGSLRAVCA